MSDEVLIWTDAHVHPHKRKVERLEDCLKVVDWVFQTARQRKIEHILFGGDLFHDRQKIEIYTYQRLYETLRRNLIGDLKLWLLLGNHDLWFNEDTSISSVIPFSSLPGVTIIDKPTRIHNVFHGSTWDFIPFTHDPLTAIEELKKKPGKAQYCLGHIAIDGAVLHGSVMSDVQIEHDGDMVKISADLFGHYKNVILGHYHAAQKVSDVVEYLGSPLELSFGEANQTKHILALNCVTGKKTYIENDFSPKHLILRKSELHKHNLEGNFVQVLVDEIGATDLIQMRKEVTENNNVGSLEIKQRKKRLDEHVIQDAKAILYKEDEMLTRYVDEVGSDGLDRDLLLKIGRQICEKTVTS